ncbi:hypothetical protein Bestia_00123 [Acinetobacter phage Bestia]|nr:hypothetical protein Bestia_00123 [Acinetobacter phage Bestia]
MSWFKRLFGTKVVQQHNIVSGGSVVAGDYVGRNNKSGGSVGFSVSMSGGSVNVNGKTYTGKNIQINGDQVIIDGVVQEGAPLVGPINVTVNGDVESLRTVSGDITVNGSTGSIQSTSGDVEVKGDVVGNVQTVSGDVLCKKVEGDARTVSGDIKNR